MKTWLANRPCSWLLIIDNADNPKIDYAAFFPSGNKGNIILTSRNPQCRELATLGSENLDHLDRQNAESLLFNAAKMDASSREANQKAAQNVVQALGFHTLAIIQAGAFIKRHHFSLEEYSILFKTQAERILQYRLTQEQSTYGSVFATFEISATHMQSSQDQSAADALSLLQILGFFHFQEIPQSMFSTARDEAILICEQTNRGRPVNEIYLLSELQTARLPLFIMQQNKTALNLLLPWRETLNLLESYSLIKISRSGEDLSFSMHPLVHTWTRIRQELATRKQSWRAAGSTIALSMRGTAYDIFYEKLRSHVGACLDHPISEYLADMSKLEISQTHYRICYLLLTLREISRVRQLLDLHDTFKAWTSATGISGFYVQCLIAACLVKEGQPKEAVELLEPLRYTGNLDDYVLRFLATAYLASKQHQKAIDIWEALLKVREQTEEAENDDLLWLSHELGRAYVQSGQSEKAITILKHVVEIRKKTLAPTHPNRLASEFNLGITYRNINEYEKAAEILKQVLVIRRTTLNVDDFGLLNTQYELAGAYIGMGSGHYDKAVEILEQVVGIEERTLKPDNPDRLASQCLLAECYIGMGSGHYEKAAELLERVVGIFEKTRAPDDEFIMLLQHRLSIAYIGMGSGHYGKAAGRLEQVIRIAERRLEPDDPWLAKLQRQLEGINKCIEVEKSNKSSSASREGALSSSCS